MPVLAVYAVEAVGTGKRAEEVFNVRKQSDRVTVMAFISC